MIVSRAVVFELVLIHVRIGHDFDDIGDTEAVIGHLVLVPIGPDSAELALVVADAFQGSGIGTRLMRAASDEARRLGFRRIIASTFAANSRMRRLLVHAGWPVQRDAIDACVEEIELAVA